MKAQSIGNKKQKGGFSTIELLIAFAVLILSIGAVIMVSFGNQSVAIDSETNNEAISKAQALLEKARADSREDFNLVNDIPTTLDNIYNKSLSVLDLSECKKKATSSVSWNVDRTQTVNLTTFLSDISGALALGGDCDSGITEDFDNPGGLVSESLGGQGATAIDAVNNRLYVTSNKFPPLNNKDFFIYDFNPPPPVNPLNLVAELDFGEGLNDVDVARNYAYVVQDNNTNQFKVIDLTNPTNPNLVASLTLPNIVFTCSPPSKPCLAGQSIYFHNKKVYIGTKYIAFGTPPLENNEFHIYDVSIPSNPTPEASVNINHNVNDIFVSGDFAYLATSDNNHELMVININPLSSDYLDHPDDTGFGYDAPGNNDGSSVYILGNKVYLGREQNSPPLSSHDFFILNKNDMSNGTSTSDGLLNSIDLGIQNNALVTGIVVRGELAFIGLDDSNFGLKILDTSTMLPPSTCAGFNFPENSTGMDISGNFIFTSNISNDEIQVIYDQPALCS